VIVQTCIQDQPKNFDDTGRTINWVGGSFKKFAPAWHVHGERQPFAGKFPRSWATSQNDLMWGFNDKEAREEAYAMLENIRYDGDIGDMFTKIRMHNDTAPLTGAGLMKLILNLLPVEALEQMHTVDLTGKLDQEMIEIISKAGRTTEKWEEAKKNLSTRTPRTSEKTWEKPQNIFRVQKNFKQKQRKPFEKNQFLNQERKTQIDTFTTQIERVPQKELTRLRNATE